MIEEGHEAINTVGNHKEETDLEAKSHEQVPGSQRVYFMSLICSPKILQDPSDKRQRFSNDLWSDKQIKCIRQTTNNVEITINNIPVRKTSTSETPVVKKQLTAQINLADTEYQRQLENIKKNFKENYQNFKKAVEERRHDQEKAFEEWVRSMKGRNFIGWHMPLREEGPKLRKLVIAKSVLKILGYEPQQFNFQFEKYTDIAVDLLNGQAYKDCFLFYLRSFQNYMAMELKKTLTLEQCIQRSRYSIINNMKGKNQVCVTVQMGFFMPNLSSVCYQILNIVSQNPDHDSQLHEYRNILMSKVEKTAFHSLSRITRLPREMNPENTNKICTYEIIRQPEIVYESQPGKKKEGSESQYVLSDEK